MRDAKTVTLAEGVELLTQEQAIFYQDMGYTGVVKIHGKIVGALPFIYTWGLCVGLDETGYEYRYCYESFPALAQGLARWLTEGGDEPTGYIKRKG